MLFVFAQARELQFVMRRCHVPIDVIFLDPAGRIVKTHAMKTQPLDTPEDDLWRYPSQWQAQFAIELSGGSAAQLKLEYLDVVDLPLDDLKRWVR